MATKEDRDDFFQHVTGTVSADYIEILKKIAEQKGVPMSRLIAYAIDNELDAAEPFDYTCPRPTVQFVEYAYRDEAHKLYNFLCKFPEGASIDFINLSRRQIGIPNRQVVMLALRELLKTKLVFETTIKPRGKVFEKFGPGITWIKLSKDSIEAIERQQKALAEKKAKIEATESKLDHQQALIEGQTEEWD